MLHSTKLSLFSSLFIADKQVREVPRSPLSPNPRAAPVVHVIPFVEPHKRGKHNSLEKVVLRCKMVQGGGGEGG